VNALKLKYENEKLKEENIQLRLTIDVLVGLIKEPGLKESYETKEKEA
jgi:hypothetical protein